MIGNALSSGITAVQVGMQRLDSSAQEIARPVVAAPEASEVASAQPVTSRSSSPTRDVTEPLIEQRQALYQAKAGVKVIQTADQILGSLLDAFA